MCFAGESSTEHDKLDAIARGAGETSCSSASLASLCVVVATQQGGGGGGKVIHNSAIKVRADRGGARGNDSGLPVQLLAGGPAARLQGACRTSSCYLQGELG